MSGLELALKKREATGKAANKALTEKEVVGVIYGKGVESVSVVGDFNAFQKIFNAAGSNHIISVKVEGDGEHDVLIKDIQLNPLTNRIHHFDMYAVKKGEKIKTEVPVKPEGESPAVIKGNVLTNYNDMIEVESIPSKIPEEFALDISGLQEVGDTLSVADIKVPEGVEILSDPEMLLYKIDELTENVVEEPEAEAAEGEEGEEAEAAEGESEGSEESKEDDAKEEKSE